MKRVTISQAQKLSAEGNWHRNHKTGPDQPKQVFSADYLVHWRPQPELPEDKQFAAAERIS